jgi:LPXTG-motif cell wall-anchored protein
MVMPQGGSSGDEEGVAIFLLVIICIGVIVGLGTYVLYRRRKSRRKETTTSTGVTTASADEPDAEII